MNSKKFYATRSREALNMVRSEFGSDAEIISNKIVNGWVEITARAGNGQEAQNKTELTVSQEQVDSPPLTNPTEEYPILEKLMHEIHDMRNSFDLKLNELVKSHFGYKNTIQLKLMQIARHAGFKDDLANRLAEKLPEGYSEAEMSEWLCDILGRNLNTQTEENELLDSKNIIALVGPTGVGKTTTLAKIAARYVLKHGAENLALITTDSYRVGAFEQLKVYGEILGVTVYSVSNRDELQRTLDGLKDRHMVLIDTPGLNQRDPRVCAQMAMLANMNTPVKRILCLNATSQIETSQDVVRVYKQESIDGCILTKVDEAMTLGHAINVVMEQKLKVFYLTNGQRVPEDIALIDKHWLFSKMISDASNLADRYDFNQIKNPVHPVVYGNQAVSHHTEANHYA